MITDKRTRIALYAKTRVEDGRGGASTTWTLWMALWADVSLMSARERFVADGQQGQARYRVIIRHIDGVPDPLRVMWGERQLRVIATSDPDNRRERLHLICEEEN